MRYAWILPLAMYLVMGSTISAADDNRSASDPEADVPVTLSQPTRGVVFYTAAINSDGTIARCFGCVAASTSRVGLGQYQVGFTAGVTANSGHSRWVQVDTLTIGSVQAMCNTADRVGVVRAVWVNCFDVNGVAVDTNFFLFVAR